MKKLFTFILMAAAISFNAQNQRFFYDYKFIPDSTNKEDVKSEMMILDVNKEGSKYYSHANFAADSIMNAELEKQVKSGSTNFSFQKREGAKGISFSVTKSYPDYKVYLFTSIGNDQYKIAEDSKPEWKILPEKEKIGEYNTQKATTNFGGREWTAWFSTDIPLQDGPYKFYGLPGIIVKIEDKTHSHIMTLSGNKTFQPVEQKEVELPRGMVTFGMNKKEIEVSKSQYRKLWKDYVNDPSKNMREIMMKNTAENKVSVKVKTSDGKDISDPNQVYREIDKRVKENLKKNNNPIEPTLLH